MSNFNAHAAYDGGKRYLNTAFVQSGQLSGRVHARFFFANDCVQFIWNGERSFDHGHVSHVRLWLRADERKTRLAFSYIESPRLSGWREIKGKDYSPAYPEADILSLLSLSRAAAAGRAPKETIPGWIEDNMPEPWSLLATKTPVAFIQALCPMKLGLPWENEE